MAGKDFSDHLRSWACHSPSSLNMVTVPLPASCQQPKDVLSPIQEGKGSPPFCGSPPPFRLPHHCILRGFRCSLLLALLYQSMFVLHWCEEMSWATWHPIKWKQRFFFKCHSSLSWEGHCVTSHPLLPDAWKSFTEIQLSGSLFPKVMKTSMLSRGDLIILILWLISGSPNASGCSEKP